MHALNDRFAHALFLELDKRHAGSSGPLFNIDDVLGWCHIAARQVSARLPELRADELASYAGEAVFRSVLKLVAGSVCTEAMDGYVATSALNSANDHLRRVQRERAQRECELCLERNRRRSWSSDASAREMSDLRSDIDAARSSGRWNPRMTTLQHLYLGRTLASIARQHGVPTSTISRRYHHDVAALRRLYTEGAS